MSRTKENGAPRNRGAVQSKASAGSRGASVVSLLPTSQPDKASAPVSAGVFVSVEDAAAVLGVTPRYLRDLLRLRDPLTQRPLIPHARNGAAYLLHRAEIEAYAAKGRASLQTDPLRTQVDVVDRLIGKLLEVRQEIVRGASVG